MLSKTNESLVKLFVGIATQNEIEMFVRLDHGMKSCPLTPPFESQLKLLRNPTS